MCCATPTPCFCSPARSSFFPAQHENAARAPSNPNAPTTLARHTRRHHMGATSTKNARHLPTPPTTTKRHTAPRRHIQTQTPRMLKSWGGFATRAWQALQARSPLHPSKRTAPASTTWRAPPQAPNAPTSGNLAPTSPPKGPMRAPKSAISEEKRPALGGAENGPKNLAHRGLRLKKCGSTFGAGLGPIFGPSKAGLRGPLPYPTTTARRAPAQCPTHPPCRQTAKGVSERWVRGLGRGGGQVEGELRSALCRIPTIPNQNLVVQYK